MTDCALFSSFFKNPLCFSLCSRFLHQKDHFSNEKSTKINRFGQDWHLSPTGGVPEPFSHADGVRLIELAFLEGLFKVYKRIIVENEPFKFFQSAFFTFSAWLPARRHFLSPQRRNPAYWRRRWAGLDPLGGSKGGPVGGSQISILGRESRVICSVFFVTFSWSEISVKQDAEI